MNGSDEQILYKKGVNVVLDEGLERYRKMRIWSGEAINNVFKDDDEFATFGQLWQKERCGILKLSVSDVSKLIEFSDRIRAYRAFAERDACSKRMKRSRKKLRKAAEDGNSVAVRKMKIRKKSAKKRAAKSYERKQGKNDL